MRWNCRNLFLSRAISADRSSDDSPSNSDMSSRAISAVRKEIVSRQPFGGFKMSGVGSKAGGPDYLLQFLEPRHVTENIQRQGFAPIEGADL